MQKYKKYKAIHRISYIIFFAYLLFLAIGNFNFWGNTSYIPYFIIIPFLIYCAIAVSITILIRRARKESHLSYKKDNRLEYRDMKTPAFSKA